MSTASKLIDRMVEAGTVLPSEIDLAAKERGASVLIPGIVYKFPNYVRFHEFQSKMQKFGHKVSWHLDGSDYVVTVD